MKSINQQILVVIVYIAGATRLFEDVEASPKLEVRDGEYHEICRYVLTINERIKRELADPGVRKMNGLPLDISAPMSDKQIERYEGLRSALLFEKCRTHYPTYSEGAIIAALSGMLLADHTHENKYNPEYLKPSDLPDSAIKAASHILRSRTDIFTEEILKTKGYTRCPIDKRPGMVEQLIASKLVEEITKEVDVTPEKAYEIYTYLNAKHHWRPEEYSESSEEGDEDGEGDGDRDGEVDGDIVFEKEYADGAVRDSRPVILSAPAPAAEPAPSPAPAILGRKPARANQFPVVRGSIARRRTTTHTERHGTKYLYSLGAVALAGTVGALFWYKTEGE